MNVTTFIINLLKRGTNSFRQLLTTTPTSTLAEHSSLDTDSATSPAATRPSRTSTKTTPATKTTQNGTRTQPTARLRKDTNLHLTPGPLKGGSYTTTRQ